MMPELSKRLSFILKVAYQQCYLSVKFLKKNLKKKKKLTILEES